MAEAEVSSMIADILAAFQNGLNVLRSSLRKHKRRHSEPSRNDEDKSTLDSLCDRPQEIKRTYDNMVAKHGRVVEKGDTQSQTSLAQILLIFNTGLIRVLNHDTSDGKKSRSLARSSIFNLSETAAMDTLIALSELDLRLISAAKLKAEMLILSKNIENAERRKPRPRSSSVGQSMPMAVRRPPPTPRLQNGGWVRSKSDPSARSVVVATKSKKTEQRKSPTSQTPVNSPTSSTLTTITSKAKEQKSPPPRYSKLAPKSPPQTRPKPVHLQSYPPTSLSTVPETIEKQLVRHPSMYIVPSDFFDTFPVSATSRYEPQSVIINPLPSPPIPPKVPLHSRPQQIHTTSQPIITKIYEEEDHGDRRKPSTEGHYPPQRLLPDHFREQRPRPPSMMTFMTASTKIGEIPEHRLPDRELTQEEQEQIPMPYVVPAMLGSPKKKNRGLKFWKKSERSPLGPIAA